MELIEREGFMEALQMKLESVTEPEGHCILLTGEAGIGKTSLLKAFCDLNRKKSRIFKGSCDALFTPRPLAPVYDIIWQIGNGNLEKELDLTDRQILFSYLLHKIQNQEGTTLIIIEDIHWADEATLDFIKFFVRRIAMLHCLVIVTYRDNEILSTHPLRNVISQFPSDSFTRIQLTPLSREAVHKMAAEKGYKGEDVYTITGGNPFYVNEILASYNSGIPDNIRDSILSTYHRIDEKSKQVWQILSILPTGLEVNYLKKIQPDFDSAIQNCLELKILILRDDILSFKHELFRRTIETSLSPLVRLTLNKKILDLLLENYDHKEEAERIIHHAKNANEYDVVVHYAPIAARQAASLGAHIEAARLYFTAIEYYQGNEADTLIRFYELYSYECYLTNQIKEAIIYQEKVLEIWKRKKEIDSIGNCMRFLSRLWWYDGNRKKADYYANEAIGILEDRPKSRTKAMALSNMSQLKMLSYENNESINWGERAISMAKELNDDEILCHALNNVGTSYSRLDITRDKGIELMFQSLQIALEKSYEDHAGRAYSNIASNAVRMKDFDLAAKYLKEGILYCEERDLDAYTAYLLAFKSRLCLEKGDWDEAYHKAQNIIQNENQPPIVKIEALNVLATLRIRKGEDEIQPLLIEAKEKSLATCEPQRIIPTFTTLLEYEWVTGVSLIKTEELDLAINLAKDKCNIFEKNEFNFWLSKAKQNQTKLPGIHNAYRVNNQESARKASAFWKKIGCTYLEAIFLFEGSENDKKEAITLIHQLGADAIYVKMKQSMRASGIKNIPRGIRNSTRSNPAKLTERELDVLGLLKDGLQNKEIANRLFISPKTVDHHLSSIFFKLDVNSRAKAVQEAIQLEILK